MVYDIRPAITVALIDYAIGLPRKLSANGQFFLGAHKWQSVCNRNSNYSGRFFYSRPRCFRQHTHTHTHARARARARTHTLALSHAHTTTHTRTHAHTHTHTHTHTRDQNRLNPDRTLLFFVLFYPGRTRLLFMYVLGRCVVCTVLLVTKPFVGR